MYIYMQKTWVLVQQRRFMNHIDTWMADKHPYVLTEKILKEFPGGTVVRILCFHC